MLKLSQACSISVLAALAATAFTASAAADEWTSYFKVRVLREQSARTHVWGPLGHSFSNPASCPYDTYAIADPSLSAEQRKALSTALTAAFLAGKRTKLLIRSDDCTSSRPTYTAVQVNVD